MAPTSIPVTRASGMGPLPRLLERAQGPRAVEGVFKAVGLPMTVIDLPDQQVPLSAMVTLFERSAQAAGDTVFGLRVGLAMMPASFGLWVVYSTSAPTLGQALNRLSQTLVLHQPGGRLVFRHAPPHVVWSYLQPAIGKLPARQHADHILPVMISVMRAYLGPAWMPTRVQMNYPDPNDLTLREDLLPVDWAYDGPGVSVRFPAALLATPRTAAADANRPLVTRMDAVADSVLRAADAPCAALEAIVALRLLDGQSDINGAARLANLSVRSLQRRLSGLGISYSQLVDRIRHRKARELLAETTLPISEIAQSLGYSDQPDFTRAFSRTTGCAPGQYRDRARLLPRS